MSFDIPTFLVGFILGFLSLIIYGTVGAWLDLRRKK